MFATLRLFDDNTYYRIHNSRYYYTPAAAARLMFFHATLRCHGYVTRRHTTITREE